jgi:hypothetical protein
LAGPTLKTGRIRFSAYHSLDFAWQQKGFPIVKNLQRATSPGKFWLTAVALVSLAACSGGGSSGFGGTPPPPGGGAWTPGIFLDANTFFAMCAAPRAGVDPATGQPYPDIQGTTTDENNFLRSLSDETYLWYDEIVDRDPGLYSTAPYFDLLKTDAVTASGQPKDKFHFTYPSDEWYQLSQSGVSAGYGAQWVLLAAAPPRNIVVAYTEPNSPATAPAPRPGGSSKT